MNKNFLNSYAIFKCKMKLLEVIDNINFVLTLIIVLTILIMGFLLPKPYVNVLFIMPIIQLAINLCTKYLIQESDKIFNKLEEQIKIIHKE